MPFDAFDIDDSWIVTLKQDTDLDQHLEYVGNLHRNIHWSTNVTSQSLRGITYRWSIPGFHAYAGKFDKSTVDKIRGREDVACVEKDELWTIEEPGSEDGISDYSNSTSKADNSGSHSPSDEQTLDASGLLQQRDAPWYLNQISHRQLDKIQEGYVYRQTQATSTVYVVDSGINVRHREFGRRASKGYNAVPGASFEDRLGHGTHVAAIIGGNKFGVVKNSFLVDVKVFERGQTQTSIMLDGYMWAVKQIRNSMGTERTVINLSSSPFRTGIFSFALNTAVRVSTGQGVTTVVAAGNEATTTKWTKRAIVVGATDRNRARAKFSDYGPGIQIFAPGVGIQSAWIGWRGDETRVLSGTSMAAPQVAGVVAYLKSLHKLRRSRETKNMLLKTATPGVIRDTRGAQNLFLYNGSGR
ncbi:subtilisin-like protein [Myriangium duriaei CBS 260.36]|uniref:Subtilisin-like protein n=1 Tax=Myriangium duriaei CBS 260.36 TaxID=1168546 RepID=A0A9P4J176_9PEZI|nr:subtilisin-like protein [Myriangium duriaei CBS 260.36]